MDSHRSQLSAELTEFAETATKRQPSCIVEWQTRTWLIDPYLRLLGYDVHDPDQCLIEYTLPIGKKQERVDYALLHHGQPFILIEAKAASNDPIPPDLTDQLEHYFVTLKTPAHFAALTNGLTWHWYCPKEGSHTLDETPFLTHDTRAPDSLELPWLHSIHRDHYVPHRASGKATAIRLIRSFRAWLHRLHTNPDDAVVNLALSDTDSPSEIDIEFARAAFLAASKRFLKQPPPEPPAAQVPTARPTLDLGDGSPPIHNRMLERAWRPPGSPWIKTNSQRQLFIDIVQHLSTLHSAGPRDFFTSATWSDGTPAFYPPTAFAKKPSVKGGYFKFQRDPDLWGWCSRQASEQRAVLTHLASVVKTDAAAPIRISFLRTNDEHAINPGPEIQAWCPAKTD